MIELTLLTLLNYVGDNFCEYRNVGHDNYKSLLRIIHCTEALTSL